MWRIRGVLQNLNHFYWNHWYLLQIPFLTFFGATAIGKAIIKTHIQTFFVVLLMSETVIAALVEKAVHFPYIGRMLTSVLSLH